jgi:hypothetical protein
VTPTRADWEAAAPKCPMLVDRPRPALAGWAPQPTRPMRCAAVMHYNTVRGVWICPQHGGVLPAELITAQRLAAELGAP